MNHRELVLCLHSSGTSPAMWRGLAPEATGGRAVLAPTNLGYPPHPPVARGEEVTLDDEVRHVLSAVPGDVARVHVVAHSYGATVALAAIPRLGARLASLVLAEPVLFGALADEPSVHPEVRAEARAIVASPLLDPSVGGEVVWLEAFVDYWNRPGAWAKMPEAQRRGAERIGWKMFLEARACSRAATPLADYRLDVPTTLVFGERTTAVSRATVEALARGREGVAQVALPSTGHMAPVTHPALVHAAVAGHFARLVAA